MTETPKDIALWVAEKLWGTPYKWGGDDPMEGVDCSGFVLECLWSADILPDGVDMTADQLKAKFLPNRRETIPERGDLLFWFTGSGRAKHVELVWAVVGGKVFTIGAAGGGSRTTDEDRAAEHNAYVKIRRRKTWDLCANPFRSLP